MRFTCFAMTAACLGGQVLAQESYWIANRAQTIQEVSVCGTVLRTVNMGNTLRSASLAPDGKVWVIRYIQPTFDIFDPVSGTTTAVPFSLGSAFDVAYDAQGHAWVTGHPGVEEFDAAGNSIATYQLQMPEPLGITIDPQGNKWIAHRVSPGGISRIDGVTGAVSTFPMTGPAASTLMEPVRVLADYRDISVAPVEPSHIWVVGDSSGDIVEFDPTAPPASRWTLYNPPATTNGNIERMATDASGNVWIGDYRNGNLFQFDRASGTVVNTFSQLPTILGLAFDGFGRLWSTHRFVSSPSQVRRLDTASGMVEVNTTIGLGANDSLSTRFHYALVVDQFGDLDGDGVPNVLEILEGTSPNDPQSNSYTSVNVTGGTRIGDTASLDVHGSLGGVIGLLFATGANRPGMGFTFPPLFSGELLLDAATIFTTTPAAAAPYSIPIAIGVDPALDGFELFTQGFGISGTTVSATNVTCLRVWM